MSQNKCYVMRIRKKDATRMPTIAKLFNLASKKNDASNKSVIKDCGDESFFFLPSSDSFSMSRKREEKKPNDVSSEG